MMKLKLLNFSFVLIMGVVLLSCVDEPFIAPVKTPYSIIRVGNFSNVDNIKLSIDNNISKTLGINSLTTYFKVTSGNRKFTLLNSNGDTLYSRLISIISYAQETVMFSGYFDPTVNNLKFKLYRDSKVYLADNTPPADTANIRFLNLLTLSPTDSVSADLTFYLSQEDTNNVFVHVDSTKLLSQFDIESHALAKGSYQLSAVSVSDTVTYSTTLQIASKKNYYIISNGGPANFNFTIDSQDPLPPQSK